MEFPFDRITKISNNTSPQPQAQVEVAGGYDLQVDPVIEADVDNSEVLNTQPVDRSEEFYNYIGEYAESNHGSVPMVSNDARDKKSGKITYDIGFGHKLTTKEITEGMIYGIPFGEDNPLSSESRTKILQLDMAKNIKIARAGSWDKKLKDIGSSWEDIDQEYKLPLTSLAYNVGGTKASEEWTAVLKAAADNDALEFAKHLRRKDAEENTKGMDNRVMKELYAAGFIKSNSARLYFKSVLPLATWRP